MNYQKLKRIFSTFSQIAKPLIKNKRKTLIKVQEGSKKAFNNKASLTGVWDNLQLLLSLVKDYSSGAYTNIPTGSIVAIMASLLYFISPLDLVPDFIPGLGFIDDVYVLTKVYGQIAKDLEKYKKWKATQTKIMSI